MRQRLWRETSHAQHIRITPTPRVPALARPGPSRARARRGLHPGAVRGLRRAAYFGNDGTGVVRHDTTHTLHHRLRARYHRVSCGYGGYHGTGVDTSIREETMDIQHDPHTLAGREGVR